MSKTSMHVPLHVLIIHHSTSMKLFHSFSTDGQTAPPTLRLEHHSVISPPPFPFPSKKTANDSCSSLYVLFFTIHHIEHDKTSLQPALLFQSILQKALDYSSTTKCQQPWQFRAVLRAPDINEPFLFIICPHSPPLSSSAQCPNTTFSHNHIH